MLSAPTTLLNIMSYMPNNKHRSSTKKAIFTASGTSIWIILYNSHTVTLIIPNDLVVLPF